MTRNLINYHVFLNLNINSYGCQVILLNIDTVITFLQQSITSFFTVLNSEIKLHCFNLFRPGVRNALSPAMNPQRFTKLPTTRLGTILWTFASTFPSGHTSASMNHPGAPVRAGCAADNGGFTRYVPLGETLKLHQWRCPDP